MSDSLIVWLLIAVLSFWAIGAYNRLMRLRSRGIRTFAALEGLFNQLLLLVQTDFQDTSASLDAHDAGQGPALASDAWVGLSAAAQQFSTSLKVAHAKPLNGPRMGALRTAYESLCSSWLSLRNLPPDLAGAALPDNLQLQWEQLSFQVEVARAEFNRQVVKYNQAIDQFPALLLAWLVGFKPAQPM